MSRNKHKRNWERVAVVYWPFHEWWLLKGAVCVLECLSTNLAFQEFFQAITVIFTLLEELNTNLQGISIPPHSCLQWRLRPVTSTHKLIFPPRAIKYHKIHEYSPGKWPTVSLFLTTFMANLSTASSSSSSAWRFLPISGFQTSLQTWYFRTDESKVKFLHVWTETFRPWPRLLPWFKAWLLSTRSFCFIGEGISTLWRVSKW